MEENSNVLDMNQNQDQTEQCTMQISDNSREDAERDRKRNHTVTLWVAVIFSTLGSTFLNGYYITVVASSSKYVHEFYNTTWIERYGEHIGADTITIIWSITVSIYCISGGIGSIIGSVLVQRLGRRNTLLVNNCFTLTAVLFMGVSESAGSFEMLAIGRFISGLSAGTSQIALMMYLTEISPKQIRGSVCSTQPLMLNMGVLFGQVLGLSEILGQESRWIYLYVFISLPAILQLAFLSILPESPRYLLIQKNDEVGAMKALQMFRREEDVSDELEELKAVRQQQRDIKIVSAKEILRNPTVRWQLITACILAMGIHFIGTNALYFYSNRLFRALDFDAELIPYVTLSLGGADLISTIIVWVVIERTGRRILLIVGHIGMAVFYIVLTVSLVLQDNASWLPYLSCVSVLAVLVFNGIGAGAVSPTVASELFEYSSRSSAMMIYGIVYWLANFTLGITFPYLQNALQDYLFLVFMGICVAIAIFLFFVLPETKAKTFMEISQSFSKLNKTSVILTE